MRKGSRKWKSAIHNNVGMKNDGYLKKTKMKIFQAETDRLKLQFFPELLISVCKYFWTEKYHDLVPNKKLKVNWKFQFFI